jgi:hypothetical protein
MRFLTPMSLAVAGCMKTINAKIALHCDWNWLRSTLRTRRCDLQDARKGFVSPAV